MSPSADPLDSATRSRGRRTLLLIALVCVLPLLAALYFRFVSPPPVGQLAGEALSAFAFPWSALVRDDQQPLAHNEVSDHWLIVHLAPGACDTRCQNSLYLTRQARTAQGRGMTRIQRLWIISDDAQPASALLALHPDLVLLRVVDAAAMVRLQQSPATDPIYLVDRRGQVVFRYAPDTEPKAFIRELGKLIKF